jgi:hypothetical protein
MIKFLHTVLLSIAILPSILKAENIPLKIHDALMRKKVACIFHGNGASTHYLEPLSAELTNISNEAVNISIENGDMFIPDDPSLQNIVVTSPQAITLLPKEKKIIKIKGMCTEENDGSGKEETIYTFSPARDTSLKKLADFIALKKYQTSAAQYAVWSLMNKSDLNTIYSADSTEEKELKKFMASLTGRTYVVKKDSYRYNYYAPPKETVGGNFGFSFSKPKDVQIAMFDKNGILVRELYNVKKVPAGDHTFKFEFDSSVYTEDVYYFKLIMGNEVMMTQELNTETIRDRMRKKIESGN